ncbi:MAG: ubiquinone biosynthesis accessory factor UbiJ [Pseudomonadota bacterium]
MEREKTPLEVPSSLLGALEIAINSAIAREPDLEGALASLDQRVVGATLAGPGVTVYAQVLGGSVVLFSRGEKSADVHLSAPPGAFLKLALSRDPHALFGNSDVRVEGDVRTAQQFQQLLASLDLDWEEHLAQLLASRFGGQWGDLAARQVGLLADGLGRWLNRGGRTLQQALRDYLQEEARHLPTRIEVDNFADDVDQLRLSVERLEARIRRLRR